MHQSDFEVPHIPIPTITERVITMNNPETFAVSEDRLDELAQRAGLVGSLTNQPVVAMTAVAEKNPSSVYMLALEQTLRSSRAAHVPHMALVDPTSHRHVARRVWSAGGIAVEIGQTEGGLASPYVIGAQLTSMFAGAGAKLVKFEGPQNFFADTGNADRAYNAGCVYDVTTVKRSLCTWATMPGDLNRIESLLGDGIHDILHVPYDTVSGIMILNELGRQVFIQSTTRDRPRSEYVAATPYDAITLGLHVGSEEFYVPYHPKVKAAEENNSWVAAKRLYDLDYMIEAVIDIAGGEDEIRENPYEPERKQGMCVLRRLRELSMRLHQEQEVGLFSH